MEAVMQQVGVLGSGDVARTLAAGLKAHGYTVQIGSRTADKVAAFATQAGIGAGTFAEVAAWADTLVLSVKGTAALAVLEGIGAAALAGKTVIDTTNPIADAPPEDGVLRFFTGPNESLMERLQAAFPAARFVKAFSCIGSALMVQPALRSGQSAMFICGDDEAARATVAQVCREFGHDVWDMGTAKAARAIEPLSILWCLPGFRDNDWTHALAMLRA
jgi:8-hydroxy-5-deazaflavin:NADPH oxidoreductase